MVTRFLSNTQGCVCLHWKYNQGSIVKVCDLTGVETVNQCIDWLSTGFDEQYFGRVSGTKHPTFLWALVTCDGRLSL